jgi:hypothetical protein
MIFSGHFFPPMKQFVFVFVFTADAGYETYLLLSMTGNTEIQNHHVFCYYATFSYIIVVISIVGGHDIHIVDIRLAIRNTGISLNIRR